MIISSTFNWKIVQFSLVTDNPFEPILKYVAHVPPHLHLLMFNKITPISFHEHTFELNGFYLLQVSCICMYMQGLFDFILKRLSLLNLYQDKCHYKRITTVQLNFKPSCAIFRTGMQACWCLQAPCCCSVAFKIAKAVSFEL